MTHLQRVAIAPHQRTHQCITLTASQHHYLRRVLRLQPGDRFIAMDGTGCWLVSQLTSSQEAVIIETLDTLTELPLSVTLVMAMPKQGMDDVVRQSTELGVTAIQPVVGDRTLLHPSPQKIERWQRIAQEAAEQSERRLIPAVFKPCLFVDFLAQGMAADQPSESNLRFICAARHDAPHLLHVAFQQVSKLGSLTPDPAASAASAMPATVNGVVIAVGPEGGWTDDEMERAIAAGYQPVSLGQRILRAVTAPIMALSLMTSVIDLAKHP